MLLDKCDGNVLSRSKSAKTEDNKNTIIGCIRMHKFYVEMSGRGIADRRIDLMQPKQVAIGGVIKAIED